MNFYSVFYDGNLVSGNNVGFLHDLSHAISIADCLSYMHPEAEIVVYKATIFDDTIRYLPQDNLFA